MKYIYHYNQITGEYLGKSMAQPDPETAGLYIVPANATLTPIPQLQSATDLPIYKNGLWSIIEDIRGKYYSIETRQETIVIDINVDISKLTKLKPETIYDDWNGTAWVFNTDRYKADKINSVSQASFSHVETLFPAYKLNNIMAGVCEYDAPYTLDNYRQLASDCRAEFYRIKALIENATDKNEIDNIQPQFPALEVS